MKIRNGFVSNSSSSSFIILLSKLSDTQKKMIYDHIDIGKKIDDERTKLGLEPIYEYYDEWEIKEDDFSLWCFTKMDNFDLLGFIIDEVKIKKKDIKQVDDYWNYDLYLDPEYNILKRSEKIKKIKNKL